MLCELKILESILYSYSGIMKVFNGAEGRVQIIFSTNKNVGYFYNNFCKPLKKKLT